MKVLVADGLAPEGLQRLRESAEVIAPEELGPDGLLEAIADVDAVIVRSRTRLTAEVIEAATALRVIARAGVGVDNIDVEAATRRGILILNAPESSTISTAEHTMGMVLALARQLPAAHLATAQGGWQRERFTGFELYGKTLGIVGLGKIGSEVARRAVAFGMRVIVYDPYIAAERAERLGAEPVSWEALLARSDIITLHVPLTAATRRMIGAAELARMRPGVRIVNCARGGLIDEEALLAALQEGHVAGAAIDAFETEPPHGSPLLRHPRVIVTPHLGASTEEAQRRIAVEVAEQVLAALAGEPVHGAVNAPLVPGAAWQRMRPYIELLQILGAIAHQLTPGQVQGVEFTYEGEIAAEPGDPLRAGFLVGLLRPILDQPVNLVNAALLAAERGIEITEARREHSEDFSSLVTVRLRGSEGTFTIAGTLFGHREPRITRLDGYRIDVTPTECMLFVWNDDRPGMIGKVGTMLGNADVNIAYMEVGRDRPRGKAIMVLGLDEPVPDELLAELTAIPGIVGARFVRL